MRSINKIAIYGSGNVAFHLAKALSNKSEIQKILIHARNNQDKHQFEALSNKIYLDQNHKEVPDIQILAVSDQAILQVSSTIQHKEILTVHTAGSCFIDVFKKTGFLNYGCIYPLQTFSKLKDLNYQNIPFFISANSVENKLKCAQIIADISLKVHFITDVQRLKIHIAAVFCSNFTNHLFTLMDQYLSKALLDFDIMMPLINETIEKLKFLSPEIAQTGPAIRNDFNTLLAHQEALKEEDNLLIIYNLINKSIQSNQPQT